MEDQQQVKEILESIGYSPKLNGKSYNCIPLYRDSDSHVLFVDKNNGLWYDFKDCRGGELKELVRITLGKSMGEAERFLKDRNFSGNIPRENEEEVDVGTKHYPKEWLDRLEKNHLYWKKRGVKESTVATFKGGIAKNGRMYYRYVFPIFNEREEIIGFNGRDVLHSAKRVKWKILGKKKTFCYPYLFNKELLHEVRKVILVESIGDMLRLWDNGIKNTLVLFGVHVSPMLAATLIKIDPTEIVIAVNNDKLKNGDAGNKASAKIKTKLSSYFDPEKIIIHLPQEENDFGDMTDDQIKSWENQINNYRPQG
jgi:hypothetical protein